jgi:hypothetical protein
MTLSGRATELEDLPENTSNMPACPIELPSFMHGKNHCEYSGWYHTDVTLPSVYFLAESERPPETPRHRLDFTYLFNREENVDFDALATGRRIRAANRDRGIGQTEGYLEKRLKADPEVIPIENTVLLRSALTP